MSRTKLFLAAAVGCLSLLASAAYADAPLSDSQITDRVVGKLAVDDPAKHGLSVEERKSE